MRKHFGPGIHVLLGVDDTFWHDWARRNVDKVRYVLTHSPKDGITPLNLGDKYNILFDLAANDLSCDGVLHVGADDYLHDEFFEKIKAKSIARVGSFGVKKAYIRELETKKTKILQYKNNATIGIRLYNAQVIREIINDSGRFWPSLEIGLDGCAIALMKKYGWSDVEIESENPILLLTKSVDNLWKFGEIAPGAPLINPDLSWAGFFD